MNTNKLANEQRDLLGKQLTMSEFSLALEKQIKTAGNPRIN